LQADAGAGRRRGRDSINVRRIGDETVCGSDANLRDSWIFLLQHDRDDVTFHLNSSLIRITLTNIDRIEQLVRSSRPQQQQRAPVRRMLSACSMRTRSAATFTTLSLWWLVLVCMSRITHNLSTGVDEILRVNS